MTLSAILALLTVFVAAPLCWFVLWRLWMVQRATPVLERAVIRDRVLVALILAILVTVFGLVFVNNDLAQPVLTIDTTRLLTRGVVLAGGTIPAGYWLWIYR